MRTKLIICDSHGYALEGIGILTTLYKTYPDVDGHKLFMTSRAGMYTIVNYKPDLNPPDEREVIFCTEDPVELLNNRKHVDAQLSISKITRSKNSENTCRNLIDWLLCKRDS